MEIAAKAAKVDFPTIAKKKRTAAAILRALEERDGFLVVGHRNPDEDCVAAMVAFGLLAVKLNKTVYLAIGGGGAHEQFDYLLKICTYNSIVILGNGDQPPGPVGAVIAIDTPKPDMLDMGPAVQRLLESERPLRMEVDHHIGADSTYFGDEGYRLVAAASSASELVGYLALKMDKDEAQKARCQAGEILSRNVVLAVLTGIIGDSRMGKYLKTRRERWFYELFSSRFDQLLAQKTRKGTGNFTSKEEVFDAIASLSSEEQKCFESMMSKRRRSRSIAYVLLDERLVSSLRDEHGDEMMTAVAKAAADALAEESGCLGLLAYPDHPALSDFVQFRVRRCHSFRDLDLRATLDRLSIKNGGGHPGAVGFRFRKSEVPDLQSFAAGIIEKLEDMIKDAATSA